MAIQTKTDYFSLGSTSASLHGLRFRALTSVDEIAGHPSSKAGRVVVGTLDASGYVLDSAAGTIARAPGLAPVWARVVYQWDDGVESARVAETQARALKRQRRNLERGAIDRLPRVAATHADPDVRLIAGLLLAQLRETPPPLSDIDPED